MMVDNLAEKVDKSPLNWGRWVYCLHTIGTAKTFCYTEYVILGLLKYWSERKDSQDFQNCPIDCRFPLLSNLIFCAHECYFYVEINSTGWNAGCAGEPLHHSCQRFWEGLQESNQKGRPRAWLLQVVNQLLPAFMPSLCLLLWQYLTIIMVTSVARHPVI